MRAFVLLAFAVSAFAQEVQNIDVAQMLANQIAPPSNPARVVAVVDGAKITADELFRYYKTLNSGQQFYFAQNRQELLERYAAAQNIIKEAEKSKLDQKEPYRAKLINSREAILTQARYDEIADPKSFTDQQLQKFYNEHLDYYTFAQARGIMVPGGLEAKAKAEEIVKRIRGGEPFFAVAREVSADRQTAEKGGLIGMVNKMGQAAEEVRKAIFALKPGQTGDPVAFRDNLWIFSMDGIQIQPFASAKDDVIQRMKQEQIDKYLETVRAKLNVKLQDEDYFKKPDVPTTFGPADMTSTPPKK